MRTRTKVGIAGAVLVAAVAGGAGIAGASGAIDDDGSERAISGSALEKASAAALAFTGDGRVTGTEVGDEESYYEVEVTRSDGRQVDVQLDESFAVVGSEGEGRGDEWHPRTGGFCAPTESSRGESSILRLLSSGWPMLDGVRVLLVEDDVRMAAAMRRALLGAGVVSDVAGSSADALWKVRAAAYDAMVLDVMLPDADGFETCRLLRADGVWLPVIMVTARDAIQDRVRGLDAGADDYLTKPFSLAELLARLRALVRRDPVQRPSVIEIGSLRLDPAARQVWRGSNEIALSTREFALLETFMRRPGQVLSQQQILESAWDFAYEHRSNVVEVYVRYLREKVDRPFGLRSLETVRGTGYRFRADGGG